MKTLIRSLNPLRGRTISDPASYHAPLSAREIHVLRLCSGGLSNRGIAEVLSISVGTTKGHLHRIFGKLGVCNRTAAAAKAREWNLF